MILFSYMIVMTTIWYNDISSLWKKPLDFFPVRRRDQSDAEFVNALVRFVLYVSVLLTAYTRKPVMLAYGGVVIVVVSFLFQNKVWTMEKHRRKNPREYCRIPTVDNPYANTLTDEFGKGEWPPCEGLDDEKQRLATLQTYQDMDDFPNSTVNERQFMTLPNAGYGPDFAGFADHLATGSGLID